MPTNFRCEKHNTTEEECAVRVHYKMACTHNCKQKTKLPNPYNDFNCPVHGWFTDRETCLRKLTERECQRCVRSDSEIQKNLFTESSKDGILNKGMINELLKPYVKRRKSIMAALHVIINTENMTIAGSASTMKAAQKKAGENTTVISAPDDLLAFTIKQLKALKKATGMTGSVDNKTKAAPILFEHLVNTVKPADEKRITKSSLLRAAFAEKAEWDRDSLIKRTGYDERNLHTALAIMKNPDRTKAENMLNVVYDRKTKIYSVAKSSDG